MNILFRLLLSAFILALVIYCVICMVNWDGSDCDENNGDCDTCPFPCDKHTH